MSSMQNEQMSVDEFIQTRVQPEFHPVVRLIRELMKECAPEAQEVISYGIPAYRINRIIAVISPTKKDITLAFSRGIDFEDKYGLLQGVGKVSKHVKLKDPATANQDALRYYIKQAVDADKRG
jgi:hypothetical protein